LLLTVFGLSINDGANRKPEAKTDAAKEVVSLVGRLAGASRWHTRSMRTKQEHAALDFSKLSIVHHHQRLNVLSEENGEISRTRVGTARTGARYFAVDIIIRFLVAPVRS